MGKVTLLRSSLVAVSFPSFLYCLRACQAKQNEESNLILRRHHLFLLLRRPNKSLCVWPWFAAALFIPPFLTKKSRYPRECVFLFVSHLSAPSLCVTLNCRARSRQYLFKYFSSPIIRLFPFSPFFCVLFRQKLQSSDARSSFSLCHSL